MKRIEFFQTLSIISIILMILQWKREHSSEKFERSSPFLRSEISKDKHMRSEGLPKHRSHSNGAENHATRSIEYREAEHFNSVLTCFRSYSEHALEEIKRRESAYANLHNSDKSLLPTGPRSLDSKFRILRKAVAANQMFLNEIIRMCPRRTIASYDGNQIEPPGLTSLEGNMDKVIGLFHILARDWSKIGEKQRNESYGYILGELERWLPVTPENRNLQRVLIPGAGTGRLMLETFARGYYTQGNDFCWQVLMASQFILNSSLSPNCFLIFPFIDDPNNKWTANDLLQCVPIPDINIEAIVKEAQNSSTMVPKNSSKRHQQPHISVTAGEWLHLYADNKKEFAQWDSILTCFFLDTASNPIAYLQAIYRLLRPGGIWINFGPLQYHWKENYVDDSSDSRYRESLELSMDEILHVCERLGFEIVNGPHSKPCSYANQANSMAPNAYNAAFFTMRKPSTTPP